MTITTTHYLALASVIFFVGLTGVATRKNALIMFMSVELMLNAANLTFVAYAKELNDIAGHVAVFFTLLVAAAEVAVGLAIMVAIFKRARETNPDNISLLRETLEEGRTLEQKGQTAQAEGGNA